MSVTDAKRLKGLKTENARLKKVLAESILESETSLQLMQYKRKKYRLRIGSP